MTPWRREPRSVCHIYDEDEYVAGEDEDFAGEDEHKDEYVAEEEWDALPNVEQVSLPSGVSHSSRLLICGLLAVVGAGALSLFLHETLENGPLRPAVLGEPPATGRPAVPSSSATRQGAPEASVRRRAEPTSIFPWREIPRPSVSRRTQPVSRNPAAITWGPCRSALAHAPTCGQMRQADRAWQARQAATRAVVSRSDSGEQFPDTEFGFER